MRKILNPQGHGGGVNLKGSIWWEGQTPQQSTMQTQ
jgi:hypothetical protein